jgi:hypothetical protein
VALTLSRCRRRSPVRPCRHRDALGNVFSHNTGLDPLAGKPKITPTTIGRQRDSPATRCHRENQLARSFEDYLD